MTPLTVDRSGSPPPGAAAAVLLLADGRLPAGGHAHSAGLEEAVAAGRVTDAGTLETFLSGRLSTSCATDAALVAAGWGRATRCTTPEPVSGHVPVHSQDNNCCWEILDAEAAARTPSAALRRASRSQGRGLLRVGRAMWPHPVLDGLARIRPEGPLWPVAFGATAVAAGLDAFGAVLSALHAGVSGPAWAATRLLGLDPYSVAAALARLAPAIEAVAADASMWADPARPLPDLPAFSAPLTEIGAEHHAGWEVRLFAS